LEPMLSAKINNHDHNLDKKSSCISSTCKRIEIAPGMTERLRGAQETWECVQSDFYLPVTCFSCCLELFCILDANYVLCPSCKVVSPMEDCHPNEDRGVGLGFTIEDLLQWQREIISRERCSTR
jgi:hypothetical protein